MVHPSKKILQSRGQLFGKRIVLGVTASVSLYKSLDLARDLMRNGADIHVVMTRAAAKLISPEMFRWATGNNVVTKITGEIEHVELSEMDSMVIAPATMNTLVKLAYGISDNSVLLTAMNFLGEKKTVFVVPAMHLSMYQTNQLNEAIQKLREDGIVVLKPYLREDVAHYPDIPLMTWEISSVLLRGKDLSNYKILVTAGPTREFMDPVRFISNPSSGTMGVAIANEAYFRGASVRLVHGPLSTHLSPVMWDRREVRTTQEMMEEVKRGVEEGFSIVILAGAPADFSFSTKFEGKIDTHGEIPKLELTKTPKISSVAVGKAFVVGFSAETVNSEVELLEKAKAKMNRHGFDIIITNNVSRSDIGFNSTQNEVTVITKKRQIKLDKDDKVIIARRILDIVKDEVEEGRRV
ncbi:bifunctional phosphopantothenoylcysteine decarboxylase/phosphopantothenate--cysteine ligase CoaBC [Sulfuracidifex tepidarius]|uniref:Coenzyme A biosynthesis bifunctional protein CoaBC n=1 Tax=Sulfuracidifex tepidarius TaxID=1294262 RepID=A0A510E462_9CREN|nr:Flavin prenyltransferase UbiX [Sulfuracidifex tepidarius]BBG27279.1 Flavin prenyltransferase UbiX [Sulfuracidifex tepidarius]